jgi:isochorismate synthase
MSDGPLRVTDGPGGELALGGTHRASLEQGLARALARARGSGRELIAFFALSLPPRGRGPGEWGIRGGAEGDAEDGAPGGASAAVDPTAIACASRRPGEPWFCFEQPARAGAAVAGLGEVVRLRADGPDRFARQAARWRELAGTALRWRIDGAGEGHAGDAGLPRGPLAVGGFAFAPEGAAAPIWSGFGSASLSVPEVSIVRAGGASELGLSALVAPDDTSDGLLRRLLGRVAELRGGPLPLLDPATAGEHRVASAMPPEHFEAAVGRATELIRAGEIEKVVLAREVQVHAPRPYDPPALLGALRDVFPACFTFCVGRGETALVGASPELLVRREGQRLSTLALAGSARRSADPAVDAHLGEQLLRSPKLREEQQIVVRRIERALRPHALWVAAASEPGLVRVANIQHLGTPIRAQLARPRDALELAGLVHPTPAVGGEPAQRALALIPALEGLDRGWYAGPLGWTDAAGDGELCVALRCALLRGAIAHCYAGNGIVRESEPAAELQETELKLGALLPLLAG